jgi:hypothetical protein
MKATFVEATGFTRDREAYLPDDLYARLQHRLMANPEDGDVVPGCGGLRKSRVGDAGRGKGKRGGARVVYLHVPEAGRFLMLVVYGKGERDDLDADEKRHLKSLADDYKREAVAGHRRRRKGDRT